MSDTVDVIIVGSGPGGVNAAAPLVAAGKRVLMLDYGNEDRRYAPLIPHEAVQAWQERVPALRPQTIPETNHYTILFDREGAAAVSQAIRAAAL